MSKYSGLSTFLGMPSDVDVKPEDVAIIAAHVIEAWTEGEVSAIVAADLIFEVLEGEPALDFLLLVEAVLRVKVATEDGEEPAGGLWN